MSTRPTIDDLLQHAGWARALARSLVHDRHAADDLVQRAWVAALERPPADRAGVRGWIAGVLRNLVRSDRRARARRVAREAATARPEAFREPIDGDVELQRILLASVQALGDPCRATVWARYYEGLMPREIARRDGVPVKTVKARLQRGLAELRTRLDREHGGDRRAWLALFAPWLDRPALPATVGGVFLVNAKLKVACVIALAAAGAVWLVRAIDVERSLESRDAASVAPAGELAAVADARTPLAETAPPVERERALALRETPAPSTPPASAPALLRGRVVDLEHRAVGGLSIEARTPERASAPSTAASSIVCDANGRFEIDHPHSTTTLVARGERWVTVLAAYLIPTPAVQDVLVVVAPRRELAGVVVDERREPVASAEISFELDKVVRRDLGVALDALIAQTWNGRSDANGRFALDEAPLASGRLVARAPGFEPARIDPPPDARFDLEIVLRRPREAHAIVRGVVLDPERVAVAGAWVALGGHVRTSDARGRFEFDLAQLGDSFEMVRDESGVFVPRWSLDRVCAIAPGRLPAEATLPPVEELRAAAEPHEVELVLGSASLSIRGVVLDDERRPVAGVMLRALGERDFGGIETRSGGAVASIRRSFEQLIRGEKVAGDTRSASDGRFEIEGLLDKSYRVYALDSATLRPVVSDEVRAGSHGVEIVLGPAAELEPVAGRVVAPDGTPVEGVDVVAGREPGPGEWPDLVKRVTTGADGRFDLGRIAARGVVCQVTGPTIFFVLRWTPPESARLDELEIRVSRRCHVQVDLGDRRNLAEEFSAVDAHGDLVQAMSLHGDVMMLPERHPIVDGKSEPVAIEETARTIVLFRDGKEAARVPLAARIGELTVVRP